MSGLLPYLVCTLGFAVVLGLLCWFAVFARRRGASGGGLAAAVAAHDEAFRVTSYEAYVEVAAQADRKAPLPAPDGPGGWRGGELPGAGLGRRPEVVGRTARRRRGGWGRRVGRVFRTR